MVSVVVPCYNSEKTLAYCLKSIQNQTQREIEIVLVDDGSVDMTAQICDKAAELDPRIKVVHKQNGGLMNAWKTGVQAASGDYIAFCDADDYMDDNMIAEMEQKAFDTGADIVMCGMVAEYSDGKVEKYSHKLKEGYYSKCDISDRILPQLFSNGEMESACIMASRCIKIFKKENLTDIYKYLDDRISFGEDDITTFATILTAQSIYCMQDFYPYHYVRNDESMIGKYDSDLFAKILALRQQLLMIAEEFQYKYLNQIDEYFLSMVLLCVKKEICRNKGNSNVICRHLRMIRENDIVKKTIKKCNVKKYKLISKVFAYLFIGHFYYILYAMTKFADYFGTGKQ